MAKRFKIRPRPDVGKKAPAFKPRGLQKTRPIGRKKNQRILRAMRKGSTKSFSRVRATRQFRARVKGSARRFTDRRNAERQAKAAVKARRMASIERFRAKGNRLKPRDVRRMRLAKAVEKVRAARVAAARAAKQKLLAERKARISKSFRARMARLGKAAADASGGSSSGGAKGAQSRAKATTGDS